MISVTRRICSTLTRIHSSGQISIFGLGDVVRGLARKCYTYALDVLDSSCGLDCRACLAEFIYRHGIGPACFECLFRFLPYICDGMLLSPENRLRVENSKEGENTPDYLILPLQSIALFIIDIMVYN